jgi:type II secretory pathway pseudopilin PulG
VIGLIVSILMPVFLSNSSTIVKKTKLKEQARVLSDICSKAYSEGVPTSGAIQYFRDNINHDKYVSSSSTSGEIDLAGGGGFTIDTTTTVNFIVSADGTIGDIVYGEDLLFLSCNLDSPADVTGSRKLPYGHLKPVQSSSVNVSGYGHLYR